MDAHMDTETIDPIEEPQVTPTRESWLTQRRTGIGASDAPAALGLSPWSSPWDLWGELTGLMEPEDLSDNQAIEWGHRLEEPIAQAYAEHTGREVVMWPQYHSIAHADYPWMRCTPDSTVDRTINGQIKTANAFAQRDWRDGPPLHYQVQVQHEMAVRGAEDTVLIVLFGGQQLKWFDVPRNDKFIAAMIPKLEAFWNLVETKTPPPIDGSEATYEAIKRLHPNDSGLAVDLSRYLATGEFAESLEKVKRIIKDIEAEKRRATSNLRAAIGDATYAVLAGGATYSLKTQTRQASLCPHCGERTGKPSVYRVLREIKKLPDGVPFVERDENESNQ